jgi:hypothetical protein
MDMTNVYVAMFEGQGGFWFSQGLFPLRDDIRKLGARADVYRYVDEPTAHIMLDKYQAAGWKPALWGYSLGTSTVLYEQSHRAVDLVMCCAVSTLETTWKIAPTTKRSILWTGPGVLSSGGGNLGFQVVNVIRRPVISYIPFVGHLWMQVDPLVTRETLDEVSALLHPPGATYYR